MRNLLQKLKAAAVGIDRAIEVFAVSALGVMVLIVTMQVVTRKLFNFVFFWSEEITILLLIWFSFLGIAIGIRDGLHIAMNAFANQLSKRTNLVLDYFIHLCHFGFGVFLVAYGWEFTMLMSGNTMTATGWSSSVKYIIMPITGIMLCIYSSLHMLGIDTAQHKQLDSEVGE